MKKKVKSIRTYPVVKSVTFVLTFLFVFAASFAVLTLLGLTPEILEKPTTISGELPDRPAGIGQIEAPVRITSKDIGLDSSIVNPTSRNIKDLDRALLSGAVRYPGTAELGTNGTMLLFGHSSYLPIVRSRAYKTFNNIQNLEQGDTISVYSDSREYRYQVTDVEQANATVDSITIENNGRYLKLVTCNSFGSKEDRFIVTAVYVGVYEV